MAQKAIPAQDLAWCPAGQRVHLEPHTVDGYTVGHDQDVTVDAIGLTGDDHVLLDYRQDGAVGRVVYQAGTLITLGWAA